MPAGTYTFTLYNIDGTANGVFTVLSSFEVTIFDSDDNFGVGDDDPMTETGAAPVIQSLGPGAPASWNVGDTFYFGGSRGLDATGGSEDIYIPKVAGAWQTTNAVMSLDGASTPLVVGQTYTQTTSGNTDGETLPNANPDFIVEGSESADTIDSGYLGDPDGDRVDNLDAADGSNDDSIEAYGGNDNINAGLGNDTVDAGIGNDSVLAGAGNDSVIGGDDNDTVFGEAGNDTLLGGAGDDSLDGDGGSDSIDGGAGQDTLIGDAGNDTLLGGADNDEIYVSSGLNQIDGGSGDDLVFAGSDADSITGGTGSDTLTGGLGNDTIYGDTSSAVSGAELLINGSFEDGTHSANNVNGLTGWSNNSGSPDSADDGTGAESWNPANAATDGTGYITMWATTNSTNESISQVLAAPLDAGTTYTVSLNAISADRIGGQWFTPTDIPVAFEAFDVTTGTVLGSVTVQGTSYEPYSFEITPSVAVTTIAFRPAGEGIGTYPSVIIDELSLSATPSDLNDSIDGGAGDDLIFGEAGSDTLQGGADNDTVSGGAGDDSVYGGAGDDSLSGGADNDYMEGWIGNDTMDGGSGNDYLDGADGNDLLTGGTGNDTLLGGNNGGEDTLIGGAGDDSLSSGDGNDTLAGGTGDDIYRAAGGDDRITLENDFGNDDILGGETGETNGDTLDLSAVTDALTIDLSNANPETGTVTDGTGTASFLEIENIVLGSGADTLVLADGGGSDTVEGFDVTDSGDGTAIDQLDVSGLTSDGGTTPVNTNDVTVTDTNGDGTGDAILTFPGGEAITLVGILPSQVDTAGELAAIGIPSAPVDGTAGDDSMGVGFVDAQGDIIDGADGLDDTIYGYGGNDVINAGNGTDEIYGGTGDDTISALGGSGNLIDGGDGSDQIAIGISDNDTITGGEGGTDVDTLTGAAANDTLNITLTGNEAGTYFDDDGDNGEFTNIEAFELTAGNDTFSGAAATTAGAIVDAGAGDDTILGTGSTDSLDGGIGVDTIDGGAGNDTINLGDGDDTYVDGAGDDLISGGEGKDRFDYTTISGNDTVVGGEINDTTPTDSGDKLDAHNSTDNLTVVFDGDESGTMSGGTGSVEFSEIEHIMGGQGTDSIDASLSSVQQILDGGEGSDTLQGGTGDDIISMGLTQDFSATDGDDDVLVLEDGFGNDSIEGFETPTDLGGGSFAGNDQLDVTGLTDAGGIPVSVEDVTVTDTNGDGTGDAILQFPNGESITLFGVPTSAVASDEQLIAMGIPATPPALNYIVEGSGGADTINAAYTGDPEGDRVDNNDALDGSNDDSIQGFGGDDSIAAGTGNDTIDAGDGNDTVLGGTGDDSILGGLGDDVIFAENGNDTILAGDGNDTVGASIGADSIDGGAGNDSLSGGGLASDAGDTIFGGTGDDTISGGNGDDSLFGNEDNDSISGDAGNDTIEGGTGNDTLDGGDGNDSINGDIGNDSITGGAGDDFLRGSFGEDTLIGGTGDDTLWGGFGDDSLVVDADFGDYTIEGEEEEETLGDTMDVSGVTDDLTWDLTNANPEAGSFTDGVNTGTYVDIENIILGSGTDTLTLGTFGGSDRVEGFDAPTDTGGGTFSGNDQLDVTGLADFDGNPTHTGNVVVSDDGSGNAVLTFGNGETLTLVGVPVAAVSSPAQLIAMGIPEGPDGYVDGTAGDDIIDATYTGDPNFDRIDANDAQLPGAAPNDDHVRAGDGNDSVLSDAGDDTVELGTGDDTANGGIGNDTLIGEAGNDSLIGGLGDDSLLGGADDDTLNGQIGADVMDGGAGSDVFALEDDFGADTIIGGEIDDAAGDTLDMSGVGGALSYDLTGVDAESGTVSDGVSTLEFSEIENIVLSSGTDTLVLGNGSGADVVEGFTPPFDDGAGTWVGIDQVDVSTMTDANGALVNTGDVTISDTVGDGSGDVILEFPGGETLTLVGVSPSAFPVPEALAAIGIPLADYIVEGTAAGELIDSSYLGDPEGDVVDAGDGDPLLPDANSDSIEAGGGDDTIFAGLGDDTIIGGAGGDLINGQAGNDSIVGGLGADSIAAGDGNDTILAGEDNDSINAGSGDDSVEGGAGNDLMSGGGGADTLLGGAGDDTILAFNGFGDDTVVGSEDGETTGDVLNVSGVSAEGVSIIYGGSESGTITGATTGDTIEFSEIENITATGNDDTIDASPDGVGINLDAGGGDDQVIGGTGSDTILGGAGSDTLSGGEGGDSLAGGAGNDTVNVAQGDTVTGGDGDDFFNIVDLGETDTGTITIVGGEGDETNGDTLALNGLHDSASLVITDPDDVNGGLTGTVTLLDGTIINFSNIENIICFVPGTMIATPTGLRAIEELRVGDPVVTQDNGIQNIGWIGTSTVKGKDRFAPVRFAQSMWPGALDDLTVSPQHRMLIKGYRAELLFGQSEVLVPAIHLVDGADVQQLEQDSVTYVHVMFEQHEIIFANGIPAESFHPGAFGVDALAPAARDELFALFPELRSDLGRYGASARTSLKSSEAKLLAQFR